MSGPARPAGPDPERDARRAAYAARERTRISRAFDAFLTEIYGSHGWVESVDPERRAVQHQAFHAGYAASELQHKGHYGVSTARDCRNQNHEHFPGDPLRPTCTIEPHYGVRCEHDCERLGDRTDCPVHGQHRKSEI